jgi:hypothetical protein
MRRGNLIHQLRRCEERLMRRGNLIHPPRHCEERSDVAISSFRIFSQNKKRKR